jgi:hypothetical protein
VGERSSVAVLWVETARGVVEVWALGDSSDKTGMLAGLVAELVTVTR